MKCSTLIFFVVAYSAVFGEAVELKGTSPYCKKSQLSRDYPGTKKECCGHEGVCDHYIEPNKTKWNLTNSDPEWIIRHCKCDIAFYKCVVGDLDSGSRSAAEKNGFSKETCFKQVPGSNPPQYKIFPLLEVLKDAGALRPSKKKPLFPLPLGKK